MNHFTTLRDYIDDIKVQPDTNLFVNFLQSVVKEFCDRFQDKIDGELALFVINPFLVSVDGDLVTQANRYFPWTKEVVAELEMQLLELQSNQILKTEHGTQTPETFWASVPNEKFAMLRKLALTVLTMFGSTYTCESAFSTMTAVKTKYRSSITDEHLCHCMRLALTPKKPNFKKLASELQGQVSH